MRIGIDAHMLGHLETGNETYIRELVRALVQLESDDEFFVFVEDESCAPVPSQARCRIVRLSTRSAARRLLFELPRRARELQLDLLHVTYNAPLVSPCPLVVTVHDLSFIRHPEFFHLRDRLLLNTLVPRSVRVARAVLTDTESAKRDLIEVYGLPAEKIVVTPYAASAQFHPSADSSRLAALREKYHTSEHYLLGVGNIQPRKNFVRLVEAYAQALRAGHLPHKLVLVGAHRWKAADVLRAVEVNAVTDHVVFTDFVPADDLPLLYNGADAFVFPSLYEGFGLPVLEAMASGVPVITSNTSALPEIAGDAAVLVNPRDVNEIARAIIEVLTDSALRAELQRRGLKRVQEFSWTQTASRTLETYRQVVKSVHANESS